MTQNDETGLFAKSLIEHLYINEDDYIPAEYGQADKKEDVNIDYRKFRSKPFIKLKDGSGFIVINIQLLCERLYNSLFFDFMPLINGRKGSVGFFDYNKEFVEKVLFPVSYTHLDVYKRQPLCTIQAYWLVRAMILAKEQQTPEWVAMIRRAILPVLEQFEADSPYANGNWGAIVNRCRMACAIFLEDSALYQASIDYYLNANDNGALPRYVSASGQCQETGRDQAHVQLGLGALCDICEMASMQGDDLWSALDNRLMKGLEYTARYNLGYACLLYTSDVYKRQLHN